MDSHLCSITSLTSTRRGDRARLALVARREGSMHEVAAKAGMPARRTLLFLRRTSQIQRILPDIRPDHG
jgi:hypothetical protein